MINSHIDVIIVLGHNRPACLRRRIEKAISLYRQGQHASLLLCGGNAEAKDMATLAKAAGIPDSALILEQQSTTTLENALYADPIIHQQHWQSAIIVTDGYHLPRAWLCFHSTSLKSIKLVSASFPGGSVNQCRWFIALLREALAIPYYLMLSLKPKK